MSAKVALKASKNNAIWMHTNIVQFVKNQNKNLNDRNDIIREVNKLLEEAVFKKFKKYVFVSKNGMNAYLDIFPEDEYKSILCNNVIDYAKITHCGELNFEDVYDKECVNLVNVSRHTEYDKRLSRLLYAADKLKDKYKFKLVMVGNGEQHQYYIDLVNELKLNENVIFVGEKENPYPYIKHADAFVMTSVFEGFPTTIMEVLVLETPIITTDVSDVKSMIDGKYGIVTKNDDESIVGGIELLLKDGFGIKDKFDPVKFNNRMLSIIYGMIG